MIVMTEAELGFTLYMASWIYAQNCFWSLNPLHLQVTCEFTKLHIITFLPLGVYRPQISLFSNTLYLRNPAGMTLRLCLIISNLQRGNELIPKM